jgi:hypothetical protein
VEDETQVLDRRVARSCRPWDGTALAEATEALSTAGRVTEDTNSRFLKDAREVRQRLREDLQRALGAAPPRIE